MLRDSMVMLVFDGHDSCSPYWACQSSELCSWRMGKSYSRWSATNALGMWSMIHATSC